MRRSIVAGVVLAGSVASAVAGLAVAAPAPEAVLVGRLAAVGKVEPRFVSYNVEMAEVVGGRFWAPYPANGAPLPPVNTQASGGLALDPALFRKRPPADLSDRRLRTLAAALGPAYVRVSGSWANTTYFQDDDKPAGPPPKGFENVLTRRQWAGVLDFARAVDARITTSFAVSAGTRGADSVWTPAEARKLVRATRALGGRIDAAELVNEPNIGPVSGLPKNYDAAMFARDEAAFRAFMRAEAPGVRILGPGSTGEDAKGGPFPLNIATEAMLAAEPKPKFDLFVYHFYGARSERCARMAGGGTTRAEALGREWLGKTEHQLAFYRDLRDRYLPGAPIWLNETAQAACGGDRWAATFVDSFRFVEQLGRMARQGVTAVFHNTLAASDYALIDGATMTPRPNYWAALLWRRTMGTTVLDAGQRGDGLDVFAHCLPGGGGGVGLVVVNPDRERAGTLALGRKAQRYTLTGAGPEGESLLINGKPPVLAANAAPVLRPALQAAGTVAIPAASISFLAVPGAGNAACR